MDCPSHNDDHIPKIDLYFDDLPIKYAFWPLQTFNCIQS